MPKDTSDTQKPIIIFTVKWFHWHQLTPRTQVELLTATIETQVIGSKMRGLISSQ